MTQQELAGTTYSKSYISAVERGKMTPSFQALRLLAARLNVNLSYLLGEETGSQNSKADEEPTGDEQQAMLLGEAEQLLHQGRHEEAIVLFERIGQKDWTSWAHERYACFLADQGRFQEAYEQMRLTLMERASG
jgi:transcriptional regulator with XRE-family HTH domain